MKPYIQKYGVENIYNSDQSGFQVEIHSGRTLTIEGTKQVECVVQSVSSTTHDYTVQPTINADGKLLSPLFIILKEGKDEFGPIVEKNVFRLRKRILNSIEIRENDFRALQSLVGKSILPQHRP